MELLEAIAITRQFFKTLALQKNLAYLSRLVIYTGLLSLLCTIGLALVYRTSSVTVPRSILPVLVTLGVGVILSSLAVFTSYILRTATVARWTVSVGPFIPPKER